jgi:predicted amidophosphoribosyltransferase
VNFLYKINSGYGGEGGRFTPQRIPERLSVEGELELGWRRYLDAVDEGDPVWIYFTGPQRYEPGVYAIGRVQEIDSARRRVLCRIDDYSTSEPLTDDETTGRLAAAVARWYEQVFFVPDTWDTGPTCSIADGAGSCLERRCGVCFSWMSLPLIEPEDVRRPDRLQAVDRFAPAYWVIPPRCYLSRGQIVEGVQHTSDLFRSFKTGNANLAYPLALGMKDALARRELERDIDAIVPIPLSPDKAAQGEIHRTLLLAAELSSMLVAPVVDALQLKDSISKRALLREGVGAAQFEEMYAERLYLVDGSLEGVERILLVDDVSTHGSTLETAAGSLREARPDLEIVAVTAAQMIVRSSIVTDELIRA